MAAHPPEAGTARPPVLILAAMPEEAAPYEDMDLGATIAVTGIGAVNAAVTATRLITELHPRLVVSTGSAGGLGQGVSIGDVVIGSDYRYHGADATAFGYELGQIPGMPPAFFGDADSIGRARDLPANPESLVHIGGMLSGDSFIAAHLVDDIRRTFPTALSTDMESTALAHACHLAGVPFVSVRAISDLCDGSASEAFHLSLQEVATRAAHTVAALLA